MEDKRSLWDKAVDNLAFRALVAWIVSQLVITLFVNQALTLNNALLTLQLAKATIPNIPPLIWLAYNIWNMVLVVGSLMIVWFWAFFKTPFLIKKKKR